MEAVTPWLVPIILVLFAIIVVFVFALAWCEP